MLTRDVEGQILGPTDVIWVYFMIAGVIALAVTMPVAGFQVWRFVVPGLSTIERRASLAYIPAIGALFYWFGLSHCHLSHGPVLPGFAIAPFHNSIYRREILPFYGAYDRTVWCAVRNARRYHVLDLDWHPESAPLS